MTNDRRRAEEIAKHYAVPAIEKECELAINRLVDERVAAERARCAKVCRDNAAEWEAAVKDGSEQDGYEAAMMRSCAAAIERGGE